MLTREELREFIWERCEADDYKTDEIMAHIVALYDENERLKVEVQVQSAFLAEAAKNADKIAAWGKILDRNAELEAENARLREELETERMRLAGCGVAALGYFDGCCDEYKSASLNDVLKLRKEVEALRAVVEAGAYLLRNTECYEYGNDKCECAYCRYLAALEKVAKGETNGEV